MPKLPSIKTVRNKADSLLTPIVKITTPRCEACGHDTEVAHHWIEKSRSTFLRYDFRNLIALCHSCHAKIHNTFGNSVTGCLDVAEIIIKKRGDEWRAQLAKDAIKQVKADIHYFIGHCDRLIAHYKSLIK